MRTKLVQDQSDAAPAPTSECVIQTVGLTKSFGSFDALKDLDLEVPKHSIVGFLGPNGAGKTTAIKLLLGLSRPTAGSANVFGLDTVRDSLAIRSRIGYLAQDPRFYTHLTARETLEFTARFFYKGPSAGIRHRIDETLELVGLADKADRPTKGFSGGERQRLGIAQAQINYPDLLILDEPAAALDPVGRRDVLDVMELLREHTTIFYSTHILDDVERVSDYVAILNQGELVAHAPTAELLRGDTSSYEITMLGDPRAAIDAVQHHPWVSGINTADKDGAMALTVSVTDDRAAQTDLLRTVMASDDIVVTAFGRKQHNLEDVFLHLVNGQPE